MRVSHSRPGPVHLTEATHGSWPFEAAARLIFTSTALFTGLTSNRHYRALSVVYFVSAHQPVDLSSRARDTDCSPTDDGVAGNSDWPPTRSTPSPGTGLFPPRAAARTPFVWNNFVHEY